MKIFISGITGTLGQAVSKKLLKRPDIQIIGYSRDELKQSQIDPHPNQILYLGDIRDKDRLLEATRGVDIILHFAALKRIEQGQIHGEEFIKTNVLGTNNILHCQRMNGIKRVILSSTDKACKPINMYGCSKASAEFLVRENPNNIVVRYGNVLASRGSVIPAFVKSIRQTGSVNITDIEMTRFFLTIDQASSFIISCAFGDFGPRGSLCVLEDMKSSSILELVNVLGEMLGVPKPIIKIIGMRPGEKIHEDLYHKLEKGKDLTSYNSPRYSKKELIKLLTPIVNEMRVN